GGARTRPWHAALHRGPRTSRGNRAAHRARLTEVTTVISPNVSGLLASPHQPERKRLTRLAAITRRAVTARRQGRGQRPRPPPPPPREPPVRLRCPVGGQRLGHPQRQHALGDQAGELGDQVTLV